MGGGILPHQVREADRPDLHLKTILWELLNEALLLLGFWIIYGWRLWMVVLLALAVCFSLLLIVGLITALSRQLLFIRL